MNSALHWSRLMVLLFSFVCGFFLEGELLENRLFSTWKWVVFPLSAMDARLDFDQLLRCLFVLQKVSLKMRLFFPWNFWIGYRNLNRYLGLKFTNVNFPLLWIWHYWCMASLTFLWSIPLDQIVQQFEFFCILENVTLIFLQTVQLFMDSLIFRG